MKRIMTLIFSAFALLFSFANLSGFEVKAETETVTKSSRFLAIADGQVRGGSYSETNYGRSTNMAVRYRTDLGDNYYESFMKFQLPKNIISIDSASLELTYQTVQNNLVGRSYTIYTTETEWEEGEGGANGSTNINENTLVYNNIPEIIPTDNSISFTITGTAPAQYDILTIDVKDLINNYLKEYAVQGKPSVVSLRIVSNATANETELRFCCIGHTKGNGPILQMDYSVEQEIVEPTKLYEGLYYTQEVVNNSSGLDSKAYSLEISSASNLTVITGVPGNEVPLKAGYQQTPSEQAAAAQADGYNVLAAINADFFRINELDAIQPRGLTIKDGQLLTPINEWTFFGIKKDGTPIIGDPTIYETVKNDLQHAVGGDCGYLVKDGVATTSNAEAGCHSEDTTEPRTAIGIKADNSIVMAVIDGRTEVSDGVDMIDLAKYMLSKGCVTAINLDGGGSSAMSIKNFNNNTFAPVNVPSDDAGERPVGNTLLVIDKATSVDIKALNGLISSATNLMNSSQYGNEIGKYPEEQKNILNIAIVTAKAAIVNENRNQTTIDQAYADLQTAINEFKGTIITKIFDDLDELVEEANSLLANSTFGEDIGNYPVEQETLLNNAINAALELKSNNDTTQDDIEAEIITLSNVIENFKASIIVLHVEALEGKIEDAYELMDNAAYGTGNNQYPYESGVTLNQAIVEAKKVLNNASAKQIDVDNAVTALQNAINEFESSKITINENELDYSILNTKIEDAYELMDNATYGTNKDQYPYESGVTLNQAIVEAKKVLNNVSAKQIDVDNAVTSLVEAIQKFEDSKIVSSEIQIDTSVLEEKIDELKYKFELLKDNNQYSAEQEAEINQAIAEAEELLANSDLTQEQIDAEVQKIISKINNLNKSFENNVETPNKPKDKEDNTILYIGLGAAGGILLTIAVLFIIKILKKK